MQAINYVLENPRKFLILLLLLFQNTGLALSGMASKRTSDAPYVASTVVILNEVIKFGVCLGVYLFKKDQSLDRVSEPSLSQFFQALIQQENLPFIVPCLIFAIQNNLVFVAFSLIDAALYQVLSNIKVLTTAVFSVVMLGKKLHRLQWMALFLLALGEALASESGSEKSGGNANNVFLGTIVMLFYAALSGFAGVFTEKMLKKKSNISFWMKSMILYFWGSVINIIFMLFSDWSKISANGFFYGYNSITWLIIFLLSFGGLLVSLVITQFDNIIKVYVTCCSLFLTSMFSWLLFKFEYTMEFISSAFIVSISILIYSDPVVNS